MLTEIRQLKKEKNAIILSHYYTRPEVQEIADFVGDSLALARKASETDADIILFAGVHFMAETAKILNPDKKVLIPDLSAGCSLADSCDAQELARFRQAYPSHLVVSYINCSAEVKAQSDLIVTSGNALKIVNTLPRDAKILFVPDKNLGSYINRETGRELVLWDGACHVHHRISPQAVEELQAAHPAARTLAHPECQSDVLALADFVGSTAAMLKEVAKSAQTEWIVITEAGILHELQKQNPEKKFHFPAANCSCCEYMKHNTLENILHALETESPELILAPELIEKAKLPIVRMLELSK